MKVNLTDIRLGTTPQGWPRVRFTVNLGEGEPFETMYQREGWTLYRAGLSRVDRGRDERGVAQTELRLPRVPQTKRLEGHPRNHVVICGWATYDAVDERLYDAIKAHVLGIPRVRKWMDLDNGPRAEEVIEDESVTEVSK